MTPELRRLQYRVQEECGQNRATFARLLSSFFSRSIYHILCVHFRQYCLRGEFRASCTKQVVLRTRNNHPGETSVRRIIPKRHFSKKKKTKVSRRPTYIRLATRERQHTKIPTRGKNRSASAGKSVRWTSNATRSDTYKYPGQQPGSNAPNEQRFSPVRATDPRESSETDLRVNRTRYDARAGRELTRVAYFPGNFIRIQQSGANVLEGRGGVVANRRTRGQKEEGKKKEKNRFRARASGEPARLVIQVSVGG